MAAAVPSDFICDFQLTCCPFCFDIVIGRFGIEFQSYRIKFYPFLAVVDGSSTFGVGDRSLSLTSYSFSPARAGHLGFGSSAT